jgi:hypothetical protein
VIRRLTWVTLCTHLFLRIRLHLLLSALLLKWHHSLMEKMQQPDMMNLLMLGMRGELIRVPCSYQLISCTTDITSPSDVTVSIKALRQCLIFLSATLGSFAYLVKSKMAKRMRYVLSKMILSLCHHFLLTSHFIMNLPIRMTMNWSSWRHYFLLWMSTPRLSNGHWRPGESQDLSSSKVSQWIISLTFAQILLMMS